MGLENFTTARYVAAVEALAENFIRAKPLLSLAQRVGREFAIPGISSDDPVVGNFSEKMRDLVQAEVPLAKGPLNNTHSAIQRTWPFVLRLTLPPSFIQGEFVSGSWIAVVGGVSDRRRRGAICVAWSEPRVLSSDEQSLGDI